MTEPTTPTTAPSNNGFFQALFDTSFTDLITMRFLKVIYMLVLVLSALGLLVAVLGAFAVDAGQGFLFLIVGGAAWLLYVILIRVSLEVIAVLFKIGDNTERMANSLGGGQG